MMSPKTEVELVDLVKHSSGSLSIRGGGTRGIDTAGEVLSVADLTGTTLYEPGALTIVVAAGTPVAEIEMALAEQNQRLAFEPMDHRGLLGTNGTPTIGGVVAGNISGPRRIQSGACRDFLLGVRYVDGRGTIVKNGGRVMKNVTGYDLVKLLAGSWGTLGVLSEVALKVLPRSESESTLMIDGLDITQAVRAMSAALGSPYDISGAAYCPYGDDNSLTVMIRVEGFRDSVAYRIDRLADLLDDAGNTSQTETDKQSEDIWRAVRDVSAFHSGPGDIWRISVKPTNAPGLAARLRAEELLFDWGGGLIWARLAESTDLRARVGQFDGHMTLVRANSENKHRLGVFHPQSAAVDAISAGLRAKFDPRGIFNTGLMNHVIGA